MNRRSSSNIALYIAELVNDLDENKAQDNFKELLECAFLDVIDKVVEVAEESIRGALNGKRINTGNK